MTKRTTYTQARAKLASICDEVAETTEPYIIERRNGKNVAVIAEDELHSLLETAHLLRSPKNALRLIEALERSQQPPSKNSDEMTMSVGELRSELGLD